MPLNDRLVQFIPIPNFRPGTPLLYLMLPGKEVHLGSHVVIRSRCRAPGVRVHSSPNIIGIAIVLRGQIFRCCYVAVPAPQVIEGQLCIRRSTSATESTDCSTLTAGKKVSYIVNVAVPSTSQVLIYIESLLASTSRSTSPGGLNES